MIQHKPCVGSPTRSPHTTNSTALFQAFFSEKDLNPSPQAMPTAERAHFSGSSTTQDDIRIALTTIREHERRAYLPTGACLLALLCTPALLRFDMILAAPLVTNALLVLASIGAAISIAPVIRSRLAWSSFIANRVSSLSARTTSICSDSELNIQLNRVRDSFSRIRQIEAANLATERVLNAPRDAQIELGCEMLASLGAGYGVRLYQASGPFLIFSKLLDTVRNERASIEMRTQSFAAIVNNPPPFVRGSPPAHALAETLYLFASNLHSQRERALLKRSSWLCTQLAATDSQLYESATERLNGFLRSSSPRSWQEMIRAHIAGLFRARGSQDHRSGLKKQER